MNIDVYIVMRSRRGDKKEYAINLNNANWRQKRARKKIQKEGTKREEGHRQVGMKHDGIG